jgi:DNA-binding response OmpR family regulator
MNFVENLLRGLNRIIRARINFSSLQFRLTLGIAIIFILGLGGVAMWMSWKMKQMLVVLPQQQNLTSDSTRLLAFQQSLANGIAVAIATTTAIATLFIQQSLRSLRQQQRQFINRIGHELRTPLSLVYGYLQTTLRKSSTLTAAEREALEIATSETERTTQLLQNLLDLARTNSDVSQQIYSHLVRCRSKTVTAHILLVEDETKLARFLELELSSEGYRVSVAHDGMEGLTRARESSPDLAVLDWMLPGLTGVELCRRLRATGIKIPVILLTARDEIGDRVTGLDAGADDYVVKPFSIEELLARIRAHLRRIDEPDSDLLQFEDLSLNRRTREVLRAQRAIELTVKEFDLLEYLLSHPRQVLTRDRILEQVWGYDFVGDSNVIEVYIRYLRLKLEENNEKRLIHTVRGVGYVLRE